jgi:hypothetical protein
MATTESQIPSHKHDRRGVVVEQWVRCGRSWCRCSKDGPRHGPYYVRFWREGGRRYRSYVRQRDADQVAAACTERRESDRARRVQDEAAREAWRRVRALLRSIEHGDH